MNTKVYTLENENNFNNAVNEVSELIKSGGIAVVPTETVYGLAADGMNEKAVAKIFAAKGRPSDNPLIFHIADFDMIYDIASEIPEKAKKLTNKFWPGPLTVILPKKSHVPHISTGGLESAAIRMPSHPFTRELIRKCGAALTAPSANLSGKPSPTEFSHCYDDMNGRVDAIVDGGSCKVGLESTVISFLEETPVLLRPGAVTPAQIEEVIGEIKVAEAVLKELPGNEKTLSPGLKYKHYSPNADVFIVKGSFENYKKFVENIGKERVFGLVFDGEGERLSIPCFEYGDNQGGELQAHRLFNGLRELDKMGAKIVYARCPAADGIGLAVYNRLIRAAAFQIIDLESDN